MKINTALATIDTMISTIEGAQTTERDRATCTDRSFYDEMDARHDAELTEYRALRDAIERGLDYSV
jgi:hypothetical protein